MSIAELLQPAAGLTPEERYVLVRLALRAHAMEPLDVGSRRLAKCFGMPDRAFVKAKDGLVEHGILFESSPAVSRGRPKIKLEWSEEWGSQLMIELVSKSPNLGVILAFMSSCSRTSISVQDDEGRMDMVRAARSSERLSYVNSLLLAVLWTHADSFGVVEGVGTKLLSELTGLDKESLKHRVGRLVKQGFICHVVPGGYSRMLGGRLESVYVLSCSHPSVAGAAGLSELLDYSSVRSQRAGLDQWYWTLHHHQERVRQLDRAPQGYCDGVWNSYHWILRRDESDVYFRQLPLLLCDYTRIVLKSGVERLRRSELYSLLRNPILADFLVAKPSDGELWKRAVKTDEIPEPCLKGVLNQEGSPAELPDVVRVICGYVLQMAHVIRACVKEENPSVWARSRIIWLPHVSGDEGFVVLRLRA